MRPTIEIKGWLNNTIEVMKLTQWRGKPLMVAMSLMHVVHCLEGQGTSMRELKLSCKNSRKR